MSNPLHKLNTMPTHELPVARPVISSPAYRLPEIGQDADHFAGQYRAQHDLPFSMVQHLTWAYLQGQQDERLKGGR